MNSPTPILPTTTSAELSRLAMSYPQLWAQIQVHPNCPPELATWITQQRSSVAGGMPNPAPGAGWNSQPSGTVPPPQQSAGSQMSAGARQMAAGAQSFINQSVIPAAKDASSVMSNQLGQLAARAGQKNSAMVWLPLSILGTAALSLLSLIMPFVVLGGKSATLFELADEFNKTPEVVLFALTFVAVIACVGLALFISKQWSRITLAAVALITGLITVFVTMDYRDQLKQYSSLANIISPGALQIGMGLYLLLLSGLAMAGLSIALIVLLVKEKSKPTAPVMGQFF